MRSGKTVYIFLESITVILSISFIYFVLAFFSAKFKSEYIKSQRMEINKFEVYLNTYIESRKFDFLLLKTVTDSNFFKDAPTEFSDIYTLDTNYCVTKIYKQSKINTVFPGFDFKTSKLKSFLTGLNSKKETQYSQMLLSPETEELSIYFAVRDDNRIFIGRIGLEEVKNYITTIAGTGENIIIIATKDGYVLSSSADVHLKVLPDSNKTDIMLDKEYLYGRKRIGILDNDIVILTPLSVIENTVDTVRAYYPYFIIIVLLILFVKVYFQYKIIIKPITNFVDSLKKWTFEDYESFDTKKLKLTEIEILYTTFEDKTRQIYEAVTEIHNQRLDLDKMRSHLQSVIDSMPSILITIDSNFKIKEWNNSAIIYTSILAHEAIGESLYSVLPSMKKYDDSFRKVYVSNMPLEINKETLKLNNEFFANISIFPIKDIDEHNIVIRIDDITEFERIERQLRQSQKMELVGNLAGGLAHDFNNALGGIVSTLSLMNYRLKISKNSDEILNDFKSYINIIDASAKRASEMVSQLLTLSRKYEPTLKEINYRECIERVVGICKNSFDKSINIITELPEEMAYINADENQIEQVILNICINASHAMTLMRKETEYSGGNLTLCLNKVFFEDLPELKSTNINGYRYYWKLAISDTGVGMGEEILTRIFDPFFTTKEKGRGTGIGLSMVYNIVKSHDGHIAVVSEPGIGSTFTVYLPAIELQGILSDEPEEINLYKGTGKILVIDDEAVIRSIYKGILTECGYEVFLAYDGEDGIKKFALNYESFDLVILDMAMPKKSGLDVLPELKEIRDDINVLLASGYRHDYRVEKAFELGVNAFLQKPFTANKLSEIVYNLINNKT